MFGVLFFVCGITGIMGRPSVFPKNITNQGLILPPWPQKNVFLLPTILKIDDVINVTLLYGNTPGFAINLISQDSKTNSLYIICNITVDVQNKNILIQTPGSEDLTVLELDVEENETMFNLSFKRRKSRYSHEDGDLLSIHGKTFFHQHKFKSLDYLRMLQFVGDNIKVSKLEFQFNSK